MSDDGDFRFICWPSWDQQQRLGALLLTVITTTGYCCRRRDYIIYPNQTRNIMSNVTVGHKDTLTIQQLDQNGNPMLVPVAFSSAPVWTSSPSVAGIDTFVAAADGSSAVLTAEAPGSDTVTVTASAVVGGNTVSFKASVLVTIQAVPQVLSSIAIVEAIM